MKTEKTYALIKDQKIIDKGKDVGLVVKAGEKCILNKSSPKDNIALVTLNNGIKVWVELSNLAEITTVETKNNIHNLGSSVTYLSKDLHIIETTNKHIEKIKYEEIMELLKNSPEVHHSTIEKAIRDRNYELLGVTIVMAIYQTAQANIKNALYP